MILFLYFLNFFSFPLRITLSFSFSISLIQFSPDFAFCSCCYPAFQSLLLFFQITCFNWSCLYNVLLKRSKKVLMPNLYHYFQLLESNLDIFRQPWKDIYWNVWNRGDFVYLLYFYDYEPWEMIRYWGCNIARETFVFEIVNMLSVRVAVVSETLFGRIICIIKLLEKSVSRKRLIPRIFVYLSRFKLECQIKIFLSFLFWFCQEDCS